MREDIQKDAHYLWTAILKRGYEIFNDNLINDHSGILLCAGFRFPFRAQTKWFCLCSFKIIYVIVLLGCMRRISEVTEQRPDVLDLQAFL